MGIPHWHKKRILPRPSPQFPADFVTFTEEIFNGKLHFFAVLLTKIRTHKSFIEINTQV